MIRLVRNADDLGLTPAVSARIGALLAAGALDDASVLSCGAAFADACTALRGAKVASVGLHLCVVGGETPVLEPKSVPTLAPGGCFRGAWPSVALAAAAGRIRISELESEWTAQAERLVAEGFAISHLDSHQHLHLLPRFLPAAIAVARRFGVPFVRAPRADDPAVSAGGFAGRVRARLLSFFGASARKALARAGFPEPPRVLGLAEAGRMTAERWVSLLDALREEGTYEIAIHPGEADDATRARYRWGYSWDEEATGLEAMAPKLAVRGITVTSFAKLAP